MATTTSVLASNIDAFDFNSSNLSPRGTRVYTAATWLDSETPNGRYEIEKLSQNTYVVTHHQVIKGGQAKIVRRVCMAAALTKTEAVRQAEEDSKDLAANVMHHLLVSTAPTLIVES